MMTIRSTVLPLVLVIGGIAAAWGLSTAVASGVAVLSEMSALQDRPAIQVAPVVFVTQTVIPIVVAPLLFGESFADTPLSGVPLSASLALLVTGARMLPHGAADRGRGLDPAGLALLTPAAVALVLPLVLGQPEHWPVWGWICLAGSAVLFGLFAVVERRVAARGGSPLIPGRVLSLPGVTMGVAALFVTMAVFGGFFFALALHLQGGLGDTPLRAGLIFAPSAATFALVSLNWQRLPRQWHGALIIAGFAAYAAGLHLSFAHKDAIILETLPVALPLIRERGGDSFEVYIGIGQAF